MHEMENIKVSSIILPIEEIKVEEELLKTPSVAAIDDWKTSIKIKENNNKSTNGSIAYKCKICGEHFSILTAYKEHRRQHFVSRRTCKMCQTVCQSLDKLEIHTNIHLGVRPYKCKECSKSFISRHHLKLHQRCHTTERKYSCTKCSETFKYLDALRRHTLQHNNIKEYRCKVSFW